MRYHQPARARGAQGRARRRPAARPRRVRDALDRELSGGSGAGVVQMIQRKLEVTYQPFDRTTRVPPGTTLFSAAHWIGLPTYSTCRRPRPPRKAHARRPEEPDTLLHP